MGGVPRQRRGSHDRRARRRSRAPGSRGGFDATRLVAQPLLAGIRRFLVAHEWDHAERWLDALAAREGRLADEARDELVLNLVEARELERARAHVARLPDELAALYALELAIADGPASAWPALVRAAREAIAGADKIPSIDLAYALLRAEPALGIVAARACIGALQVDDPELLLEAVEDARDRLNVAPDDPAWAVLDALSARDQRQADDAAALRASLQESSARIDELERTLSALRAELADARTRPAAELMRPRAGDAPAAAGSREREAALDARVQELEALIREGNAERRELRKQLQASSGRAPVEPHARRGHDDAGRREGLRPRRAIAEDADEGLGEDVAPGARAVAVPRFDRRAVDAIADVPAAVAAEAMRTLGSLAAGDAFAWRGVKQAKDMARQVLMARVGIHHRLLFRVEDRELEVLDLVTREQLMTTLKRLRGQR